MKPRETPAKRTCRDERPQIPLGAGICEQIENKDSLRIALKANDLTASTSDSTFLSHFRMAAGCKNGKFPPAALVEAFRTLRQKLQNFVPCTSLLSTFNTPNRGSQWLKNGVFPQNNAGATNPMFTEGPAIKLNDEVKVVNWWVTYIQGCSSIKVDKGFKITMNATASAQFKLYITVGRA